MGQAQRLGWPPEQLRRATWYEYTAAVEGQNAQFRRKPPHTDPEALRALFRARPEHEVLH